MIAALAVGCIALLSQSAAASSIIYSNLGVTNGMAAASRPEPPSGGLEIEAADDFLLGAAASITSARFIGIVPVGFHVNDLNLEMYRVFPNDSTNPPNPIKVPTRVNSPSDVAFAERDLSSGIASFSTIILNPNFTAQNSVLNGLAVNAGGEGSVTGQEVEFDVVFSTPFLLPADHYFFVPQVGLESGNFFWLSAARPIPPGPPNTPFAPEKHHRESKTAPTVQHGRRRASRGSYSSTVEFGPFVR